MNELIKDKKSIIYNAITIKKKRTTGFVRSFDNSKINKLQSTELFIEHLKVDVIMGEVFPAIRRGVIDFYYAGGSLYRFNGSLFTRDKKYNEDKYQGGTEDLCEYLKAKKQNENKNIRVKGIETERKILDKLNKHTFIQNNKTKVVVLDIEVRLNGNIFGNKKCDMVLLNTQTNQIMFVEGKIFSDKRVNVATGFTPEVIEQVRGYTEAIREQAKEIVKQYFKHIQIINDLFDKDYNPQITLIDTAKLLVYETPFETSRYKKQTENRFNTIKTINKEVGEYNVFWIKKGQTPSIDEIWEALCK